jgi:ATP synthase protein I
MVRPVQEGWDVSHPFVPIPHRACPDDLLHVAAAAMKFAAPAPLRADGAKFRGNAMPDGPEDADELKARLAKLTSDLRTQRESGRNEAERKAEADMADKGLGQAMSLGFRVLSEFVAAIVVGAVIGWRLDEWFGTSPGLLILFLGFGVAAGFWTIYRLAVKPPGPRGR